MAHDSRDHGGKDHGVIEPAQIQHLDTEERPRNRGTEHRREPRADAADDEAAPVVVAQPHDIGEETGERRADLRSRTLLAHRPAEREGDHRRAEFDRGHDPVDPAGAGVHRGDDGLGAVAPGIRRERTDQPDTERERDRQKDECGREAIEQRAHQPARCGQRPEKAAGPEADAHPGDRAEQRPLDRADEQRGVLGVPALFVGQARRPRQRLLPAERLDQPSDFRSEVSGTGLRCVRWAGFGGHFPMYLVCPPDSTACFSEWNRVRRRTSRRTFSAR